MLTMIFKNEHQELHLDTKEIIGFRTKEENYSSLITIFLKNGEKIKINIDTKDELEEVLKKLKNI